MWGKGGGGDERASVFWLAIIEQTGCYMVDNGRLLHTHT